MTAAASDAALVALALLAPLAALGLLAWPATRRALPFVAPWTALPALVLSLTAEPGLVIEVPWLLLGARLTLDATGVVFLFLSALLWLLASLYAVGYVRTRRPSFWAFSLLAMAGNLALPLAGDAITFYLGFSVMGLAAYGLIIHDRSPPALEAGRLYVALVVVGEALVLSGLLLLAWDTGDLRFAGPGAAPPHTADPLVALLLLAGFGIKAGLVPLHVWLPLAHPMAPSPASAVLSGAMIKAGLLGWLRTLPLGEAALPTVGALAMILGFFGAFYGVLVGLTQRNPKTLLAYSSISQMGLMTVLVGFGLMRPEQWPTALVALLIYALHHALAKGALFLGVGVATSRLSTRSARAITLLGLALPAFALAGAPWTTGAVAKLSLETALAAAPELRMDVLVTLLSLSGVGTTLLMARFLVLTRPRPDAGDHPASPWMTSAWLTLLIALASVLWLLPWTELQGAIWSKTTLAPSWSGLWPLAVGVLLAGLALLASRAFAPQQRFAVPPGDLLVPVLAALRALARTWDGAVATLARAYHATRNALLANGQALTTTLTRHLDPAEQHLGRWRNGGLAFVLLALALYLVL